MLTARPKVAELVFRLYGRPLHPELFNTLQSRTVERKDYQAQIDITSAGHMVRWQSGGITLTEVATSAHHPMPQQRRLISSSLRGKRQERVECNGGIVYEVEFQMEPVNPDLFWAFQHEIVQDGEKQGMLQKFQSSGTCRARRFELRLSRDTPKKPDHPGIPHLPRRLRHRP